MQYILKGNFEMADTISKERVEISTKLCENVSMLKTYNDLMRAYQGMKLQKSPECEATYLKIVSAFRTDYGRKVFGQLLVFSF